MNINIITVGKIKEDYIQSGTSQFKKRLGRYADLNMSELKSSRVPKNPSGSQIEQLKVEEGERILDSLDDRSYKISLDVTGKPMTSKGLAKSIKNLQVRGNSSISFIVGGPYGLSDQVIEIADYNLSLSHMTFTHQMIRLILLEQIYRAFKIINNEPYHH